MTHHDALLAAVLANPADDTPRLAYADWCDDNDQPKRAEFIRVQIELARQNECVLHMADSIIAGNITPPSVEHPTSVTALRRRERELWRNGPVDGSFVDCGFYPGLEDTSRGFVSRITCTALDWLAHAGTLVKSQPIERVTLTTHPDPEIRFTNGPNEWRVRTLNEVFHERWPGIVFELPSSDTFEPVNLDARPIQLDIPVPEELLRDDRTPRG